MYNGFFKDSNMLLIVLEKRLFGKVVRFQFTVFNVHLKDLNNIITLSFNNTSDYSKSYLLFYTFLILLFYFRKIIFIFGYLKEYN